MMRPPAATPGDKPPVTRKHLSMSDKHAIVVQLRRLTPNGRATHAVVQVAARYGISPKSVYRWLNDPRFDAEQAPDPTSRPRFEITIDHLVVLAHERTARDAWSKLKKAGFVACAYSTFAKALGKADPALVYAAIEGHPGLINHRIYLSAIAPHRCHTYHLDHTIFDLYVWPSHKHRVPVRPHLTVIVDGYSGFVWAFVWYTDVTGDMVAASLAEAGTDRDYEGVPVGGQPEQVVLDNAASHFSTSMKDGVAALGWIISPTSAYSSWQNGKAERTVQLVNRLVSDKAPGSLHAGQTEKGAPVANGTSLPADIDRESVLTAKAFEVRVREALVHINTEIPMVRHGGLTRLQAWTADQTERRALEPEVARLAMMTSGNKTYKASKNGISFKGRTYVGAALMFGRSYLLRFLPTHRDWVEVFTETNEYVCRAWASESMPQAERSRFMAARVRQERDAKAIEAGLIARRHHEASVENAAAANEGPDDDEVEGQGAESDSTTTADVAQPPVHHVDTLDGRNPDLAVEKVRSTRGKQARVSVGGSAVRTEKDRREDEALVAMYEASLLGDMATDESSEEQVQ